MIDASRRSSSLVIHAALALSACACSGSTESAGNDTDDDAFKTAQIDRAFVHAGISNILALDFTAPAKGKVWASATGTCGVVQPLPVSSVLSAQIETRSDTADAGPGSALFDIGGPDEDPSEGSFAVSDALSVAAGHSVLYLNISNPSSGGMLECGASMVVAFGAHPLP